MPGWFRNSVLEICFFSSSSFPILHFFSLMYSYKLLCQITHILNPLRALTISLVRGGGFWCCAAKEFNTRGRLWSTSWKQNFPFGNGTHRRLIGYLNCDGIEKHCTSRQKRFKGHRGDWTYFAVAYRERSGDQLSRTFTSHGMAASFPV